MSGKILGLSHRELMIYAALGIGGYYFLTKILPGILEGIGRGAGQVAAGAVKGTAQGTGTAAGAVVMAAPNAVDAALKEITGVDNALAKTGSFIGNTLANTTSRIVEWLGRGEYDVYLYTNVNGKAIPKQLISRATGKIYNIVDGTKLVPV